MPTVLRLLFSVILISMLAVTGWAGHAESLRAIPAAVRADPWFVATLFDAYWGFVTFWVWVAWKERSTGARVLWLAAFLLLGNIAMSAYMLAQLMSIRAPGGLDQVFTRPNPGRLLLPGALTAAGAAVYALA